MRGIARVAWFAAVLFVGVGSALAASSVEVVSETMIRAYERDPDGGGEELTVPIYEYLSLSAEEVGGELLSFYGTGWGRFQAAGDFYEDDVEGELYRAFFQLADPRGTWTARAGRVPITGPLGSDAVDGLTLRWRPLDGLALSAYGGSPVGVSESAGRSGDAVAGARIEHAFGYWYSLGLSYRYLEDDGTERESLGAVDFTIRPLSHLRVRGLSSYNFTADAWAEHDYAVRFHAPRYFAEPFFRRVAYEGFFESARTAGTPFHGTLDADDHLEVYGATAGVTPAEGFELGAAARNFVHDAAEDDAFYGGLTFRYAGQGPWRFGLEGGRMEGDKADNSYGLGRLWTEYEVGPGTVGLEGMYVSYDEPVLGEDTSIYGAASGRMAFPKAGVTLRLTGEYASDPYFDKDVRGTLLVTYVFDGKKRAGEMGK